DRAVESYTGATQPSRYGSLQPSISRFIDPRPSPPHKICDDLLTRYFGTGRNIKVHEMTNRDIITLTRLYWNAIPLTVFANLNGAGKSFRNDRHSASQR